MDNSGLLIDQIQLDNLVFDVGVLNKVFNKMKFNIKDPKMLIVEDDDEYSNLLLRLLEEEWPECKVDVVKRASNAIDLATKNEYTFILLDISLEGDRSGIDVLLELRRNQKNNSIICVMTSAHLNRTLQTLVKVSGGNWIEHKMNSEELRNFLRKAKLQLSVVVGEPEEDDS